MVVDSDGRLRLTTVDTAQSAERVSGRLDKQSLALLRLIKFKRIVRFED
ncbi:hypothetical protein MUN86_11475 [Hymenobacter volaticus]|uniref:Uncharacterized protein n=1 Tax=Hymenobacter volaticus TaxID=2932254 RepID=A0ABY4GCB0_9BACT|nr:hypothetical protein MUN86_11475 [Hymenobacter volaticus]